MNKLGTKLGAIAMSAVMALSFAPSAAITSLAASSGDAVAAATELTVPVYRLYKPANGEHLLTTDEVERGALIAGGEWEDEAIAWYAPTSGEKVSRLFDPVGGEHLYTSDALEIENCKTNGWTVDSTVIYSVTGSTPNSKAGYRLFNPNAEDPKSAHLLTADPVEYGAAVAAGWKDEGPKFYVYAEDQDEPVIELTVSIDNPTPKVGSEESRCHRAVHIR